MGTSGLSSFPWWFVSVSRKVAPPSADRLGERACGARRGTFLASAGDALARTGFHPTPRVVAVPGEAIVAGLSSGFFGRADADVASGGPTAPAPHVSLSIRRS